MKKNNIKSITWVAFLSFHLAIAIPFAHSQMGTANDFEIIKSNFDGKGSNLTLSFTAGKEHNHPTFAVWIEDVNGKYIQTLFVTQSLATGIYGHGQKNHETWTHEPGEAKRPATLPYFLHKRGVKAPDGTFLPTPENPIPDAYTGATPLTSFHLQTKTNEVLNGKIVLLVEVNQPWDWNPFWNNTKFSDDVDYKTSCQPALVYVVTIDLNNPMDLYVLNPIGHSHYSGKDGRLYTDLSTFTTALQIFEKIVVKLN